MSIKSSSYKLVNDINKTENQFQQILEMLKYELITKEKGIYNSNIMYYKSKDIKRFLLYIETSQIKEIQLAELYEYYFKKFKIPGDNSDIFIVISVEKENESSNYFLDCFLTIPNKSNNMSQIVPIIINRSEMTVCVGNYGNYPAMLREVLAPSYRNIQNDVKSFMNLYYMLNDCDSEKHYNEITINRSKNKRELYKKYYKRKNILNKNNISEFKTSRLISTILKIICIILINFIISNFAYYTIIKICSIYLKVFSIFYIVAVLLKYYFNINYLVNSNKIKITSSQNTEKNIKKALERKKYKKIKENIYRKNKTYIIFIEEISDISLYKKIERNSIFFLFQGKYSKEEVNINNLSNNILLITESKEVPYLYIYKTKKAYRKMKKLIDIFSLFYNL